MYPWQYAARKPLHAQRSLAYFKHGIELAEVLGAPYMSINSGWGDWDEDREEAWKRSAEHLSTLADYAGEHGVTLCMESLRPEESNLVVTLADARRMLDQVDSPHLTPMVDTTAMGVAGETLGDWFDELVIAPSEHALHRWRPIWPFGLGRWQAQYGRVRFVAQRPWL